MPQYLLLLLSLLFLPSTPEKPKGSNEPHLANIRQLTFGGQNAEAYLSWDEKKIVFQATRDSFKCDQIFTMNIDGSDVKLISNGEGRTTCSYFFPGDTTILYASTFLGGKNCPPPPDYSRGYVWPVYPSFDIFTCRADGSNLRRLTTTPGYDAEATISDVLKRIVFTSIRDGDLDIYTMNFDGTDVKRLTNELGYDGGPFFSWDGKMIVYRAYHPDLRRDSAEAAEYRKLLSENLVKPEKMEIFVMNSDGTDKRQLTHLGKASFGPFFFPDNKRIIFSSNYEDPQGRNFQLYTINLDGSGLHKVTSEGTYNFFPVFTRDGKHLIFCSNRGAKSVHELNVFIADWVE
ncbi:MAG: hypothetical protein M1470_02135 [Bacteroidetes bacterium]|nr:hypothetical protein [Bacteroidota bacterium]MCL5737917.1 hypothetical protein [Bacteroidota bacterium]